MTTKSTVTYLSFDEYYRIWTAQYGGGTTFYRPTVSVTRTRTGSSNPNWRQAIRSGLNASTPLSASEQNFTAKPVIGGTSQTRYGQAWSNATVAGILHNGAGTIPAVHDPYGNALDEADAQAIKYLYSRINQVRTQFSGGIELGQLRMTIHQMVRPAEALRIYLLKHLKKQKGILKKFETSLRAERWKIIETAPVRDLTPGKTRVIQRTGKQKTLLRALADSHLEAVYGWSPLIADIRDAAVGVARLVHDATPQRFRIFGQSEQVNAQSADLTTVNSIPFLISRSSTAKVIVIYYGALSESAMSHMAGPALNRIVNTMGLGPRDWLPTAWDLLPWSFVADCFANIGDVISAACTDTSVVARLTKVVIIETHHTDRYAINIAKVLAQNDSVNHWTASGTPGEYDRVYRTVSRGPTGMPYLAPRISVLGPSSRQWLNLAALYISGRSTRNGYQRGLSYLHG